MSSSVNLLLFTLMLVSLVSISLQSAIQDDQTAPYLITRADVNNVLSKIMKPDERIALLLDYDGTLAEINPNPNFTEIRPESKKALQQILTLPNLFLAIISGRTVPNVREKVGIENVTFSGNHGLEILFTNNTEYHYPISSEIYKNCTKLKTILITEYGCKECGGGWIEDKNVSLVYHYDFLPENLHDKIVPKIKELVLEYGFRPVQAHSAIEIKPPVVWSKGHAALLILNETFGSEWNKNHHVIYVGDDTGDEDVMEMLKGNSTTFRITTNPDIESHATYKLESVETTTFLIEWFLNNNID